MKPTSTSFLVSVIYGKVGEEKPLSRLHPLESYCQSWKVRSRARWRRMETMKRGRNDASRVLSRAAAISKSHGSRQTVMKPGQKDNDRLQLLHFLGYTTLASTSLGSIPF